jgi:PmbA protein
VAAPGFTLRDGGAGLAGFALAPFDREGQPRRARRLIDDGVLQGFLFDSREGAAAGAASTGNAVGGADAQPAVGLASLSIDPGTVPSQQLRDELPLGVLVTRFSGSTDPVSGDFSGVVKGGFLIEDGALTPIHETTVAGNVWACLRQIDARSSDRLRMHGTRLLPWIRIPDLSITAA